MNCSFSFRVVMELSRRLDDLFSRSQRAQDLFSAECLLCRGRLLDHCCRLAASDPVKLGSWALETAWRKGFYDTVTKAKFYKVRS